MIVVEQVLLGRPIPFNHGRSAHIKDSREQIPHQRVNETSSRPFGYGDFRDDAAVASMDNITLVGYLAALCSMTSFTPQAWKIIKTRDTGSISAPMYAVTVVGFALWLAFGIMKGEWPITITNGVCLVLSAFILLMTLLPRKPREAVADAFDPDRR